MKESIQTLIYQSKAFRDASRLGKNTVTYPQSVSIFRDLEAFIDKTTFAEFVAEMPQMGKTMTLIIMELFDTNGMDAAERFRYWEGKEWETAKMEYYINNPLPIVAASKEIIPNESTEDTPIIQYDINTTIAYENYLIEDNTANNGKFHVYNLENQFINSFPSIENAKKAIDIYNL